MQTNNSIPQDTSARSPVAEISEDIAAPTTFNFASLTDGFSPVGEFQAQDYSLPDIGDKPYLHLIRKGYPYASRSANQQVTYEICKRGIDIVGALTLLLVTVPLFLCVMILIKLTSPGQSSTGINDSDCTERNSGWLSSAQWLSMLKSD